MNDKSGWPVPDYEKNLEPHFLFIITPPYSGSTALAKLLDSSSRTMILQERGEGQWLVPGLCEKDRWDPDKEVNYESVRAVWLHAYQQSIRVNPEIEVVIEKSPPNMMRIEALSGQFKDFSFIANNRNPYASCASILYRRHDADRIGYEERVSILENIADKWLARSRRIQELILHFGIPLLTYEAFCENPASVIKELRTPAGVAESIDPYARVKVKDYQIQGIVNQNQRQISSLTIRDIKSCSSVFMGHEDLLDFYGYSIL